MERDPPTGDGGLLARVWGARGSIPAPAAQNYVYGSDSPCVEVRCGDHVIVLDAGSGAVGLGTKLFEEGVKDLDIFFTHCHFDHIMGLPFLRPLYDPTVTARIYAGHFEDEMTCREMAERFMAAPFFPVTPKQFTAQIDYRDFRPPDAFTPFPGVRVSTVALNHPNGCVGYRVDYGGRSLCYITDTEHVPGRPDSGIIAAIKGADAMIYDCMFTDSEFDMCVGWGHSTWEEGVRLCEAAGVAQLVIFHHRPGREDRDLERIAVEAKARFPGAVVARTGLELTF